MTLPELSEIRTLRKSLDISQKELGDKLLIPQSTVSRIENGTMDPPYSKVKKIYDFLINEQNRRRGVKLTAKDIMTKKIISVTSESTIKEAIKLMNEYEISQIPIIDQGQNQGSLTSKNVQKHIIDNPGLIHLKALDLKELPFPEVEKSWSVKEISNLLVNYPAVLVKDSNKYIGIITDSDFLKRSSVY